MNKKLILFIFISFFCAFSQDRIEYYSIKEYRNSKYAEMLDPDIKWFFKGEEHPEVEKSYGVISSTQRTIRKENDCPWVLTSVLKKLQRTAIEKKGNAIIDIYCNFKHKTFESDSLYQCAKGNYMAAVTLYGKVAKLKGYDIDMEKYYNVTQKNKKVTADKPKSEKKYTRNEIQNKITAYNRMKVISTCILAGGITLDCIGAGLVITGISDKAGKGFGFLFFGIPITIGSAIVRGIGNRKTRLYKKKFELRFGANSVGFSVKL